MEIVDPITAWIFHRQNVTYMYDFQNNKTYEMSWLTCITLLFDFQRNVWISMFENNINMALLLLLSDWNWTLYAHPGFKGGDFLGTDWYGLSLRLDLQIQVRFNIIVIFRTTKKKNTWNHIYIWEKLEKIWGLKQQIKWRLFIYLNII